MSNYDLKFSAAKEVKADGGLLNALAYILLTVLVSVTAFLLGVMYERRTNPANDVTLSSFWETWDILERDYYGELPDDQTRKFGAIEGLVNSLGDPFTSFARPEVAEVRRQEMDGHFGGVGIVVRTNEALQVVVASVIPGNPADDADIQAGDVFIEVDGVAVAGMNTDRVADLVRGEVGSEVKLRMYRPETQEYYEVSLIRAIIETPTVFSEVQEEEFGYINLTTFNGVATSQLETHLRDLIEEEGVKGLILDLRGNGGGLLDQAVSVADLFLDEGVVLTQRDSAGREEVFRSDDGDLAEEIPLVVLVDSSTASASEVVAGALQDRNRAILIGTNTFGKGVVQLVYNLSDGSQLRVTSAAWYTPNDRAIQQGGLVPDRLITESFDILGNDLILQAGLEYLQEVVSQD